MTARIYRDQMPHVASCIEGLRHRGLSPQWDDDKEYVTVTIGSLADFDTLKEFCVKEYVTL